MYWPLRFCLNLIKKKKKSNKTSSLKVSPQATDSHFSSFGGILQKILFMTDPWLFKKKKKND